MEREEDLVVGGPGGGRGTLHLIMGEPTARLDLAMGGPTGGRGGEAIVVGGPAGGRGVGAVGRSADLVAGGPTGGQGTTGVTDFVEGGPTGGRGEGGVAGGRDGFVVDVIERRAEGWLIGGRFRKACGKNAFSSSSLSGIGSLLKNITWIIRTTIAVSSQ